MPTFQKPTWINGVPYTPPLITDYHIHPPTHFAEDPRPHHQQTQQYNNEQVKNLVPY